MDLEEWEDALAFFDDALIVLAETPGGDSPEMVRAKQIRIFATMICIDVNLCTYRWYLKEKVQFSHVLTAAWCTHVFSYLTPFPFQLTFFLLASLSSFFLPPPVLTLS